MNEGQALQVSPHIPPKPGEFYRIAPDGKWEFYLDSHMIQTFALCERMFKFTHIDHWRPKGDENFNLKIGSWWSSVMETFYENMATNTLTRESITADALKLWKSMDMESLAKSAPKKYIEFCGAPRRLELNGSILTLPSGPILMVDQYFDEYAGIDKHQWRIIATEAGFGLKKEVLVGETSDLRLYLIGKPDLIIMDHQDRIMPVDHKTCSEIRSDWANQWKPHFQMTAYVFATQTLIKDLGFPNAVVDRCIVNGCCKYEPSQPRDKNKPKGPRFKRATPCFNAEEIEEWQETALRLAWRLRQDIAAMDIYPEHNWSPAASSICHEQYHRPCTFCDCCGKPPGARELYLTSNFVKAEPWAPYSVEGE
jgi:hypothetical protein